ncbi:aldo/keto reductase, partial [Candidatus Bipolaricaulota bacterium]|nr:aldo/keto reductase [Candidatus Bipolaricaulota bacterium]
MHPNIERCQLSEELNITRVLTGLWQIADMERDGKDTDTAAAAAAMQTYVDAGLTTFDMADHYGSSELIAGHFRAHADDKNGTQLFTKWVPKPGPMTKDDVRAAVERALSRMQMERLDLLQFHTWDYADPVWLDTMFWLQELKEEGLIGALGTTNLDTAHLRMALQSGINIVSNQVCFSLLDQRPKRKLLDLCLEHGVKLLCYGTLAGGFLTHRWLGQPEPDAAQASSYSQMKYHRFIRAAGGWDVFQTILAALNQVASKHGVSMANVASRYILDQPAVGGVIIGARLGQSEHIDDTLKLFTFALDSVSRSILDAALEAKTQLPGDSGDEYRKPPFLTATGDLSDHLEKHPKPWPVSEAADGRRRITTGTTWERIGGFSRAIQTGNRILVSGTTATHHGDVIGGNDVTAQAHFVLDKIEGTLQSLGSRLEDVVRTRVYIRHLEDWEAVARVHGERFATTLPANTLVRADLVG